MNKDLYLLDKQFLNEMAEQKERDIYARIISLDINENPIEQIEGKITTGNINIDGSSAVRRTCSLTMVSQEVNITDYYWGVKTKFKLEIGLKNKINKKYPDIIWYPQGIYVITTFNTSLSTNNCTISIQGKDKMCLLNGDIGGQMYASVDFGTEEVIKTEMNVVDFSYAVNSQQIMSQAIQKYYICDFRIDDNDAITTPPTLILKNNSYPYIFVKENKSNDSGIFYYKFDKQNNQYIQNSSGKYKIYKIIKNPDEIFISVSLNKSQYKSNFYYNKSTTSTGYYTIETRDANQIYQNDIETKSFYQLKGIYNKNDNYTKEKIPLEKIIREAVHTYGKEPYHNIIINDLESYGLEQLTYKGEEPLYAFYDTSYGPYTGSEEYTNLILKNTDLNNIIINNQNNFKFKTLNSIINQEDATKILVFNKKIKGIIYNYSSNLYLWYHPLLSTGISSTSYKLDIKEKKVSEPLSSGTERLIEDNIEDIKIYTVSKFEYGDDIGYRLTDLVYTGDLVSNVGDSLTSVLDKIKTMLGDFEYFYDLEGHFVFQRKKTYINVSWNTMVDNNDEKYFTFANDESKFSFNFEGNRLISAIQNSPKITNLRNDFSVWGKRKNTSGVDVDIHMRYAIDKKPVYYKALDGKIYLASLFNNFLEDNSLNKFFIKNDIKNTYWLNLKLLIKYLQIDESKYNTPIKNLFSISETIKATDLVNKGFPSEEVSVEEDIEDGTSTENICIIEFFQYEDEYLVYPYSGNKTIEDCLNMSDDYESQFYIYIPAIQLINLVDWREIVYQMALDYFASQGCSNDNPVFLSNSSYSLTDPDQFLYEVGQRNPEYYPTGYTGYEQYYTDMQGFWRQLYNPDYQPKPIYDKGFYDDKNWISSSSAKDYIIEYYINKDTINIEEGSLLENYVGKYILGPANNKLYWNIAVFEAPETLNFWIDFLDSNLELSKFSVPQIGDRSKTVKDDKVGAIVYQEIPNLVLYEPKYEDSEEESEYKKRIEQRVEIINKSGYRFINLSKGFSQFFTISYRSKSVKDKVDDLLYEHSYAQDGITITSIPIYHLEPNTIIYVKDDNTGINGEYIATRFTIPLNYNGTMSITANKAPERIY